MHTSDRHLPVVKPNRWLAMVPAVWACFFDVFMTAIHQPAAYWMGDLNKANEGNPIGNALMSNHPSGLFVISGLWLGMIIGLGYYLPFRASRVFLLFALIAHSWGASSWISPRYGYWTVIVFIFFNAFLYIAMQDKARSNAKIEI